jgi:serine protease inhibitor
MNSPVHVVPVADQQTLAAANTNFAFSLLKQLALEQPGTNIFVSPYSVSALLQLLCHGAAGQTKEEMERVLGTSRLNAENLHQAHKYLIQEITRGQANVLLDFANSIWCKKEAQLKPEFLARNEKFYEARVEALDFNDFRSVQLINDWADHHTHGRIKRIVEGPIPASTDVFIANAVYFKGNWKEKFNAEQTKERPFYLPTGRQKSLPMMEQSGDFAYRQGSGFQAVGLPYTDGRLEMHLLLPDTHSNIATLVQGLDAEVWQKTILPRFQYKPGTVILPRFRLDYEVELKNALHALGMRLAFGDADFSAMSFTPLFLSAVKHKSFVEVNEEGTEATVTTLLNMIMGGRNPEPLFRMIVDRPFLFVIHDNVTESILFMGVVVEPMASLAPL